MGIVGTLHSNRASAYPVGPERGGGGGGGGYVCKVYVLDSRNILRQHTEAHNGCRWVYQPVRGHMTENNFYS